MKKNLLIVNALLCGALSMPAATVQSLIVQAKGGTKTTYTLSSVRKITFSGSTMSVVKTDDTETDFTISNVQNLQFGSSTSAIKEVSNADLKAYPNPVNDFLKVEGVNTINNLRLYSLTGSELAVSYTKTTDGMQINTVNLPQGLYLLQINNQVIKIQKR